MRVLEWIESRICEKDLTLEKPSRMCKLKSVFEGLMGGNKLVFLVSMCWFSKRELEN